MTDNKRKSAVEATYKSKDTEEWLDIWFTRPVGYLFAKAIRSEAVFSHRHVLAFKAIYYMLISTWAIWASYRQYSRGEQMLTFYHLFVPLIKAL